jgi:hypothetical protein
MSLNDPPRLLDSAAKTPEFLRSALDAARADGPDPDQLARLARRLPIVAVPPAGPASPAPIAAIPSSIPGAIVGALLGLAVVGLQALLTHDGASFPGDRRATPSLVVAPVKASTPERARPDDAAPTPPPPVVRASSAPAIPAAPSADVAPRASDPAPGGERAAAVIVPGSSPDLADRSTGGDVGQGALAADGETEIELLQRAQDALGSAPARALDLVNRHATRFPGAALGQEREVIAIDALVRLGRTGEARARAAAFAARFPTSAHLRRLEALVPRTGIDTEVHKDPRAPAPTLP